MIIQIKDLLESVVKEDLGAPRAFDEFRVFKAWERMGNAGIREKAVPDKYSSGILYLKASNSAWAQQISLLRPQIISDMNGLIGRAVINDIKVRAGTRQQDKIEEKTEEKTCPSCKAGHRGSNQTCAVCEREESQKRQSKLYRMIKDNTKITFSIAKAQLQGISEADFRRAKRELTAIVNDKKRNERRYDGWEKRAPKK